MELPARNIALLTSNMVGFLPAISVSTRMLNSDGFLGEPQGLIFGFFRYTRFDWLPLHHGGCREVPGIPSGAGGEPVAAVGGTIDCAAKAMPFHRPPSDRCAS
jgi:hypothetical protein